MKKIILSLVLLMAFMFAQTASSATLTWSTVQTGANILTNNASAISASYGFDSATTSFTHNYSLTANPASGVKSFVIELINENILITSITLDSVAMIFDTLNSRWVGSAGVNSSHNIAITGSTNAISQSYLVRVNAVPVPAAVWLFGSALMGLVGISRRKTPVRGLTA